MWRKINIKNKSCVVWSKNEITEIYDRSALEINIECCINRLHSDISLDDFNKELLKNSILHLQRGLATL